MDALLDGFSYVFWVVLALGILVFVHELGHFLAARLFGMRVDAFSIGFPPVLARLKRGDTEYRLGAVPLGGYVKIAGMVDESLDEAGLASAPAPDEFRAKPVWQRVVVITAGVFFNIVLAFLIFIGLTLAYGEAYVPAENVRSVHVRDGSVAHEIGFRTGDRVVAVNGEPLERFDDVFSPQALSADPFTATVERGGAEVELEGPDQLMTRISRASRANPDVDVFGVTYLPAALGSIAEGSAADRVGLRPGDRVTRLGGRPIRYWEELTEAIRASGGDPVAIEWARPAAEVRPDDPAPLARRDGWAYYRGEVAPRETADGGYLLGVGADPEALGIQYRQFGVAEGVAQGSRVAAGQIAFYVEMFGRLFTGKEDLRESVGGPLMIAKQTKEAADAGMRPFWYMVAMLSIALAVFNILPIPALDGGHLVFLLYEGITRREPSLKVRIAVQQVGMVILLAFMAFVLFNDAARVWFG
jgi:regulator of sigma E protease